MLSFELVVVAHNRLLRLPCYGVEWAQQTEKIDSPWYWYCQYSSRHRCDETISLEKEVCAVHVQYFSRDGVETLLGFFTAFHGIGLPAWYLSTWVKLLILIRLRGNGQTQAQHEMIQNDTDDFWNRYHWTSKV